MTYPFNSEISTEQEARSLTKWIDWKTTTIVDDCTIAEELLASISPDIMTQPGMGGCQIRQLLLNWTLDLVGWVREDPLIGGSMAQSFVFGLRMADACVDPDIPDYTQVMEDQFDPTIPDFPEPTDDDIPYLEVA